MNDENDTPQAEKPTAEQHAQFSKIADLARKFTESKITEFADGARAPLIDGRTIYFAILCGTVSAAVTCLVGLGDQAGDDADTQAEMLSRLVDQMANVFNEIQDRKAAMEEALKRTIP